MTRDDIIKLMRESCDTDKSEPWDNGFWTVTQEELERFYRAAYAAGAATEREACARVCEETTASWSQYIYNSGCIDCAIAIRARGE